MVVAFPRVLRGLSWSGSPLAYADSVLLGAVAEWLGPALQKLSREFDSRLRLVN